MARDPQFTQQRRGVSLGGTLLAVAVLSMLAYTLASLSVTHLRLSSRQERGLAASNAARSVVSTAISKIIQSPEFGSQRLATDQISLETEDAVGILTFNQAQAADVKLAYSTNNLEQTEDTDGAGGQVVPSATVHLVGVGRSGGVERRVEAVLRLPPFPWAIASGGRIETRNGVLVAALPEGVWPPPTDEAELLPADLVANGDDLEAIVLANNSKILGDVETPGQVVLGSPQVFVRGEVRERAEPVELPTLDPRDYDPVGTEHFELSDGNTEEIVGSARVTGDITFPETLKLTNAQLFVDGDLRLPNGVQGTGILVATGDITVGAGVNLEGLTELAVISGGRVTLSGRGDGRSILRGLFYAKLGLDAAEITLVGSLLTGDASTGVTLDHVNVYYDNDDREFVNSGTLGETQLQILGNVRPEALLNTYSLSPNPRCEVVPPGTPQASVAPGPTCRLFSAQAQPTAGGYPIQVTLSPGFVPVPTITFTIDSKDDLPFFLLRLADELARPDVVSVFRGQDDDIDDSPMLLPLANALVEALEQELAEGEAAAAPPSTALALDISRFLPIEDRIRVVSWIEK